MNWILGIDGGGSKTEAYAANLKGEIIGSITVGASNYQLLGLESLEDLVLNIVRALSKKLELDIEKLEVLSLGLAGVDRDYEKNVIVRTLKGLDLDCRIIVNNDAKISLVGGLGNPVGLTVISGTGSIAYGINEQSEEIRAGGWGHIIGDEGSGYAIGRSGLSAAIKHVEKRGEETILKNLILKELELGNTSQLIPYIYNDVKNKSKIASIAKIVVKAASFGDKVSINILKKSGEDLASLALSVMDRGFNNNYKGPIVINGSILKNIELVHQRFVEVVKENFDEVEIIKPKYNPAMGAVILALNELNNEER